MRGLIAIDGVLLSPEKAAVSALDRGLLFGDAIFEVLVAFGSKILDVDRHLARLRASAEAVGMELPWSDRELEFELTSLVEQIGEPKMYLRLVVTRGDGMGLKPPLDAKLRRMTYCFPASVESSKIYTEGLALKRLVKGGMSRGAAPKTANYLDSVLGLKRAETEGFDDILWGNAEGEVTEAASANIFLIARDGDMVEFVTPPSQSGLLLGITRDTVISLLAKAKIPVHEQIVHVDELPRFDEAFLCSTVRGLVPVNRIDKHRLHTARPNAVYRHVERLFLTWVETQVGHRVDWATGHAKS